METLEEHIKNFASKPSSASLKAILHLLKDQKYSAEVILSSLGTTQIRRVFDCLNHRDIGKTYSELRKVSAILLIELAHENSIAQLQLSRALEFVPLQGKVAINKLPKRIDNLLKDRPELLQILKKEESGNLKYWSFPPLDSNTYSSSLENMFFFPDPSEYLIGFFSVKLTDTAMQTLKEPTSYSPKLYSSKNIEMQSAPVEVVSPRQNATFNSIEASISRIKVALRGISKPKTARDSPSPLRHYLTPTAASTLKSRDKSPISNTRNKSPDLILSAKRKQLSYKIDKIIKTPIKSPRKV